METNMYYEIDPTTFAISIFDGINDEPFNYQPHYPNGDAFDTYEEAESWAKAAIDSHNPQHGFFPPNGKGLAPEAKPTPEQIAEAKLALIGFTVDELKNLLNIN